jgi:succinate dehydrogenase / fumarate reductase, cytochrome b subunit
MNSNKDTYSGRPTSPHLGIYRPQISSMLSIMHRLTGVAMFFCISILSWGFIVAQSYGYINSECDCLQALLSCWLTKLAIVGISYAFIYHFCTGVRHLVWDMGKGYDLESVNRSGWFIILFSIAFTVIFWVVLV